MSCCTCKYQYNIICGSCKKPFKIPMNREERISDLQRIILQNKIDNHCYKLEIRDLQDEMEIDHDVEINKVVK